MGKKKKKARNLTIFVRVEGDREQAFLDFLIEIYQSTKQNKIAITTEKAKGGGADSIVSPAVRECNNKNRSFAWLDEDFEPNKGPLSVCVRERLIKSWLVGDDKQQQFMNCMLGDIQVRFNQSKRNPVLIVSKPVCSDGLILIILNETPKVAKYDPKKRSAQIAALKSQLNTLMGGTKSIAEQTSYYRKNLTKEKLEARRKIIPELDLLIAMITK